MELNESEWCSGVNVPRVSFNLDRELLLPLEEEKDSAPVLMNRRGN
jgi:hypothetical protein